MVARYLAGLFAFLSCGVAGLAQAQDVVDLNCATLEIHNLDGSATTLALPCLNATGAPLGVARALVSGQVIESHSGEVVIDLGTSDGLNAHDRVELFAEEPVDVGEGQTATEEERLAVGIVTAVTEDRANVALGMNERVSVGSSARLTELDSTANVWAPPRVGDLWDVIFMARPFLALGTFGFGNVSSLEVGYYFEEHIAIQAIIDPIGIGIADEGDIIALAGNVIASYDALAFQIGLGLGWSAINDSPTDSFAAMEMADGGVEFDRVRSGLSIAQLARLGTRDGVNFSALNSFLLDDETFEYGGTTGSFQIPLGPDQANVWTLVRGGGGRVGYVYGEIGLRVMLSGNGDRGSLYVTPTIGGASLSGEKEIDCELYDYETGETEPGTCTESIDYGGPMVGFGVEWRM